MRKIALWTTVLTFALVATAWAGAKDKSANTLVDIDGTGLINNTTGKTKTKSKGCKLQIQAKPIALSDGAVVICIAEADVEGIGGNSVVLAGEAKSGQVKIKADLSEVKFGGIGCGDQEAISYNGNLRCYEDDATYRGDANVPGSWQAACNAAGMVVGPAPGDHPGATKLKVNDTQSVVVGLCQGFGEGDRINPPASARWAVQGQRSAVIP